jgi:hypothetical protein
LRALVVAEFYPRAHDPVLGIWAHRQALATRDAGADVRVAVLYRPIPPKADPKALGRYLRQPPRTVLDGITVDYVPFVSPPRGGSYGRWGAWAAPSLAAYLHARRRTFDVVHAHNAIPAGDAVRRARAGKPLVVSSTAATCSSLRCTTASRASGASSSRLASCLPTAAASPAARATSGRARRAWSTSAPTCQSTCRAATRTPS